MHSRTRNLLALLADEDTDSILEQLRDGPLTEVELVGRLSTDKRSAGRRLKRLVELELVSAENSGATPGRSGPRPRRYRVSEPDEVFRFCDTADSFALGLAEAQTDKLRRHVAASRKRHVKPAASEEGSA